MSELGDRYLLAKDPHLPRLELDPYEHLNVRLRGTGHQGVDPESTTDAINDLIYALMGAGGATPEDLAALQQLQRYSHRLGIDFLYYRLEPAAAEAVTELLCVYEIIGIGEVMPAELPELPDQFTSDGGHEHGN